MGTCDWLSVNPRGNTGSRRRSKNNVRRITMGIGPIWGITSLTFILSWFCTWQAGDFLIGEKLNWLDQCSSRGVHGGTRAHKTADQSSLQCGQLQQREQDYSALMHFRAPWISLADLRADSPVFRRLGGKGISRIRQWCEILSIGFCMTQARPV